MVIEQRDELRKRLHVFALRGTEQKKWQQAGGISAPLPKGGCKTAMVHLCDAALERDERSVVCLENVEVAAELGMLASVEQSSAIRYQL